MWTVAQQNITLSQLIMWQSSSQSFNPNIDPHPQHPPPRPPPPQATPHQPPMGMLKSCHLQRLALSQMPQQIPLVMVTWPLNPEALRFSLQSHQPLSYPSPNITLSAFRDEWWKANHSWTVVIVSPPHALLAYKHLPRLCMCVRQCKSKKHCHFSQIFCARGWATSSQMWLGRDMGLFYPWL